MARMNLAGLWLCGQLATAAVLSRDYASDNPLGACPGYKASNVKTTSTGLTADLKLAGPACNVYGTDLDDLVLEVAYETGMPCL
jgi:alpha-glucosidase